MDEYIGRQEHEEFKRRMEDEHRRINHRVGDLEKTVVNRQDRIGFSRAHMTVGIQQIGPSRPGQGEVGRWSFGNPATAATERNELHIVEINFKAAVVVAE